MLGHLSEVRKLACTDEVVNGAIGTVLSINQLYVVEGFQSLADAALPVSDKIVITLFFLIS